MNSLYGGVCYAGIDTDPELKYPKGAGRVAFSNQKSYIAAISARFVQLQHGDIDKRVRRGVEEGRGISLEEKFAKGAIMVERKSSWIEINSEENTNKSGSEFTKLS